MNDIDTKLIALYARHEVKTIRETPLLTETAFGRSIQDLSKDGLFTRAKESVESQKLHIEDRRGKLETGAVNSTIGECLKLLLRHSLFPEASRVVFEHAIDLRKRLLLAMYSAEWSAPQQDHFEYMFSGIMTWKSFFLSYTNDSPRGINDRFKKVIYRHVSPAERKQRNWDKDNLLADAVVSSLIVRNLQRCFYDKKDIAIGQNIDHRISPAVDNVFAFIQLVQTEIFTVTDDNWCFKEWRLFQEASDRKLAGRDYFTGIFRDRFAAILAHDRTQLRPVLIPEHYEPWRDQIFRVTHNKELPTNPDDFDRIMMDLTHRIVNLKDQIVATVPV